MWMGRVMNTPLKWCPLSYNKAPHTCDSEEHAFFKVLSVRARYAWYLLLKGGNPSISETHNYSSWVDLRVNDFKPWRVDASELKLVVSMAKHESLKRTRCAWWARRKMLFLSSHRAMGGCRGSRSLPRGSAVGRCRQDEAYDSLCLRHLVGIPQEKHDHHQANERRHHTPLATRPLDAKNGCAPSQMLDGPLIFLWDPCITIVPF